MMLLLGGRRGDAEACFWWCGVVRRVRCLVHRRRFLALAPCRPRGL
jgi:hypothetical protein